MNWFLPFFVLFLAFTVSNGAACVENAKRESNNEDYYNQVISFIYQTNNSYFLYKSVDPDLYLEEWTVKEPLEPMSFPDKKQEFFWDIESVRNQSVYKICQYKISEKDFDLRNTYFLNGSQPEFLYYGCSFLDSCQGLECTISMCKKIFFFMISLTLITLLSVCIHRTYKNLRSHEILEHQPIRQFNDICLVRRVTSNGITVVTWQRDEE